MAIESFGYGATSTQRVAIPQHARHILFAGWTSQVVESKHGCVEICGVHSREEASIVQKYLDDHLNGSSTAPTDGSGEPKFYGWECLQGVCLPSGGIIALYPRSEDTLPGSGRAEQSLLSEPRLMLGGARDVAACGRSKDHWTVVVSRSGQLFQWSDIDPAVRPVPEAVASAQRPEVVYTRVWAGEAHMLALDIEGTLYSWGSGRHGQLGHGDLASFSAPKAIEALQGIRFSSAACGASFSVAVSGKLVGYIYMMMFSSRKMQYRLTLWTLLFFLNESSDLGDIYTFGLNDHGQLGIGKGRAASSRGEPLLVRNTALPQLVDFYEEGSEEALELTIVSVACGSAHTVALDDKGRAWSCGWGKYGQLSEPAQAKDMNQQQAFERMLSGGCGTSRTDQFLFRRMVHDDWMVTGLCCGLWSTFVYGG
ncbi:hypothetical protein KVV02_003251 [Mortierella alpina]|uniref:Uncharacterized protein n=1 Tax=Mortierella alpina TaxID=64518 RepID=A0A9P7ZW19_MORAP|nr:hypothetical protein KVV02_003251 [Mortierella alpina]